MALRAIWRRTRPLDRLVVALLLATCAALLVLLAPGAPGRTVIVERDGQVIFTAPLDRDRTFAVTGPLGVTRLAIRHGSVRVASSPCPHQVCVGMGAIDRVGQLLACVPNRLLIRIRGPQPARQEPESYDLLSR